MSQLRLLVVNEIAVVYKVFNQIVSLLAIHSYILRHIANRHKINLVLLHHPFDDIHRIDFIHSL